MVDYLKRLEAPGQRPTAATQTEPNIRATELSRQRNKENIIHSSPKPSPKDSVPISTEKKRGRGRPAKVCNSYVEYLTQKLLSRLFRRKKN